MKEYKTTNNPAQSVNFREIRMGNIAPGVLYRSSHPIKQNKQEAAIAMLAAKTRITSVINLHDTDSSLFSKSFIAPWYDNLYKDKKIIALGMDFSVTNDSFKKKLKKALQFMINTRPPYLIHCHAGVDRTGFVCMVLESFMGAKIDAVVNDYLKSFDSTYESSIFESQKADKLTAMRILQVMSESELITEHNLQRISESYLRETIKLKDTEIALLKEKLSDNTEK